MCAAGREARGNHGDTPLVSRDESAPMVLTRLGEIGCQARIAIEERDVPARRRAAS